MWKVYLLMFVVVVIVSLLMVNGIDNMQKNHPDYKGDDWLNWGDDDDNDQQEKDGNRKDYDED